MAKYGKVCVGMCEVWQGTGRYDKVRVGMFEVWQGTGRYV